MVTAQDEIFLRLAIDLARQARQQGADPFGAILVVNDQVVHQVLDRCVEMSDPTFHAELGLISEYCRTHQIMSLDDYTLYSSAEPCPMCAWAIHWAHISRVVFSVPQTLLQQWSGGNLKPGLRDSLSASRRQIEIVGPLLLDEGKAVFEGHTFVPKATRHQSRRGE